MVNGNLGHRSSSLVFCPAQAPGTGKHLPTSPDDEARTRPVRPFVHPLTSPALRGTLCRRGDRGLWSNQDTAAGASPWLSPARTPHPTAFGDHPLPKNPKKERAVIPPKVAAPGWERCPPLGGKPEAVLVIGLCRKLPPHPSRQVGTPSVAAATEGSNLMRESKASLLTA